MYDDLKRMATFGFRGEALASISHVSHVTVTTKRADAECAYRAKYVDGKLTEEAAPCAGVTGTTITAEDLFYNVATRRKALKSAADEHQRIADMLSRYALHNSGVAFTLRKQGENVPSLQTLPGATVVDNVRALYGAGVARELLTDALSHAELKFDAEFFVTGPNHQAKKMTLVLFVNNRLVSSAALKRALDSVYQSYLPSGTHPFALVRLKVDPANVDVNVHPTKEEVHILNEADIIAAIQKAVDQKLSAHNASRTFTTTQTLLPGASAPTITAAAAATASTSTKRKERDDSAAAASSAPPTMVGLGAFQDAASGVGMQARGVRPDQMVRTDPNLQTLEALLAKRRSLDAVEPLVQPMDEDVPKVEQQAEQQQQQEVEPEQPEQPPVVARAESPAAVEEDDDEDDAAAATTAAKPVNKQLNLLSLLRSKSAPTPPSSQAMPRGRAPPTTTTSAATVAAAAAAPPLGRYTTSRLTSVQNLLEDVNRQCNAGLQAVTRGATLVGSLNRRLMLWQHQTQLFVVDVCALSNELFYQLVLQRFAQFARLRLAPDGVPIEPLILCALSESKFGRASYVESDGTREEVAAQLARVLVARRELLSEYFSLDITEAGVLTALPIVLEQHAPELDLMPLLLLRLASCVDWTGEQECFRTIACELADFYCLQPAADGEQDEWLDDDAAAAAADGDGEARAAQTQRREQMEHVLFPALKRHLKPCLRMASDGSFVNVASLDKLYKVFERC